MRVSDHLRLLLVLGVTAGVALALFLQFMRPFAWISFGLLPLFLFNAMRAEADWARRAFLSCFSLALSLGLMECVFSRLERLESGGSLRLAIRRDYFARDPELGYAPSPNRRESATLVVDDALIYDVVYTISSERTRVTRGDPKGDTWLFMGCSFTFGEGVGDEETLPAFFSAGLGYQANVVNLGFPGYGPHQMLRSLETDRPRPLVQGVVKQVVYMGIPSHPARAAGRGRWDNHGPRYVSRGDSVAYAGRLHPPLVARTLDALGRSYTFRFVRSVVSRYPEASDEDIELYARILERSSRLTREKYGAELMVLYWDEDGELSRRIQARLQKSELLVVLVSTIVPRSEWKRLSFPVDQHPKPEINRRLAAALVKRFQPGPP